jgi:hypothetical protein
MNIKINDTEVIDNKCIVPLITFDTPTVDNIIFSKEVVEKCIMEDKVLNEKLREGMFFGELRHGKTEEYKFYTIERYFTVEYGNTVLRVTKLFCEEDKLVGEIELAEPMMDSLIPGYDYRTAYRIFHKETPCGNDTKKASNFVLVAFDLVPILEKHGEFYENL